MSLVRHGLVPGSIDYKPRWELVPFEDAYQLVIGATGETPYNSWGYKFEDVFSTKIDLAYAFTCWTGPLPVVTPFDYTQRLIKVPRDKAFSTVRIIDAQNPLGRKYPIAGPLDQPGFNGAEFSEIAKDGVDSIVIAPPEIIYVRLGGTFNIEHEVPVEGVRIKYADTSLDLTDSGINGAGKIFWTFKAISLVPSQIIVTPSFFGTPTRYEVFVGPPLIGGTSDADSTVLAATTNAQQSDENLIMPFLAGLNVAVELVRKSWPEAELFDVKADRRPLSFSPVTNPYQLGWCTAMFRVPNGIATTKSNGFWSQWTDPVFVPGSMLGTANMAWPLEGDLGLEEAMAAVLAKTKQGVYDVNLYQPLNPQIPPVISNQPVYFFHMAGGPNWAIGSVDKVPIKIPEVSIGGPWDKQPTEPVIDTTQAPAPATLQAPGEISPVAAAATSAPAPPLPPVGVAA